VNLDPDSGNLYVTTGDQIIVVDPKARSVTQRIDVPNGAGGAIAFDPQTKSAWVERGGCLDDGSTDAECRVISIVDTTTNKVTNTLAISDPVKAIAADPDLRRILVVSGPTNLSTPDSITAIDADGRDTISTTRLLFSAEDVTVDTSAHRAVVTGLKGAAIITTNDLRQIDLALDPDTMKVESAVDNSSNHGLIAWGNTLASVDVATGTVGDQYPFSLGVGSDQLAIDPMGYIVFLDSQNDEVRVFDAKGKSTGAIGRTGNHPVSLAVDPVSGTVYTANNGGQSLSIIERS
jgi:DNA-binding beta-propeller fold protein YncE